MRSESCSPTLRLVPVAAALSLLACEGSSNQMTTTTPPPTGAPRCTMPAQVACVDQMIDQMRLFPTVNPGTVTTEVKPGGVFESQIDARAGGMMPTLSFIYVKFTDQGLQKVAIGDEQAFESMDWDIAFRRYLIRSNSGASGPSCVEAAESGVPFANLTTVPGALGFEKDLYLEPPACMATGPMNELGGPLTAIGTFFSYAMCLQMTGEAFVIRLKDGRHVALEVLAYYPKAVQDACNASGTLPSGTSGGSQYHIRWKFLPSG